MCFLLILLTMTPKFKSLEPNFPFDKSLKNCVIFELLELESEEFLIIIRNSSNSTWPDPSSSTSSIISCTSCRDSAKPRPMSGFSNSPIPTDPVPYSSRLSKHSFSLRSSGSRKSKCADRPVLHIHFLLSLS